MTRAILQQALDALTESVDLVRHNYETNWRHGIPTRKAQLDSYKHDLDAHEKVIADIQAVLAKAEQRHTEAEVQQILSIGPMRSEFADHLEALVRRILGVTAP